MRGCLGVFTKESLTKIERRVRDERQAKQLHDADPTAAPAPRDDLQPNPQLEGPRLPNPQPPRDRATRPPAQPAAPGTAPAQPAAAEGPRDDLQPNPQLEAGRTLPARLGDFPPELYGKPIEELDEFYFNKYVSAVPTVSLRHCTTISPRCRVL